MNDGYWIAGLVVIGIYAGYWAFIATWAACLVVRWLFRKKEEA